MCVCVCVCVCVCACVRLCMCMCMYMCTFLCAHLVDQRNKALAAEQALLGTNRRLAMVCSLISLSEHNQNTSTCNNNSVLPQQAPPQASRNTPGRSSRCLSTACRPLLSLSLPSLPNSWPRVSSGARKSRTCSRVRAIKDICS